MVQLLNFPDKKYKTIVIDPAWDLGILSHSFPTCQFASRASLPYKTMSDADTMALPINSIADDNCQLFMWITQSKLPFGFDLFKAWGFKYHCLLTWDKTKGVCLHGFNRRTEFVIFGYKGKFESKGRGRTIPTIFTEVSTVHSRKPQIFYEMLVRGTPEPRIDIFARKKHFGFDAWGDQVDNEMNSLEAFIS